VFGSIFKSYFHSFSTASILSSSLFSVQQQLPASHPLFFSVLCPLFFSLPPRLHCQEGVDKDEVLKHLARNFLAVAWILKES
jgi:hypothetical protein